jgi:hypothetical protein
MRLYTLFFRLNFGALVPKCGDEQSTAGYPLSISMALWLPART